MGQMKGVTHADMIPVRMSRYPSRVRQIVITFDSPETAEFFDTVDDITLMDAVVKAMREA